MKELELEAACIKSIVLHCLPGHTFEEYRAEMLHVAIVYGANVECTFGARRCRVEYIALLECVQWSEPAPAPT